MIFRTTRGAVVYRLEPESVPFDVAPFSGDVFSQQHISQGRFIFEVVAKDAIGQVVFFQIDEIFSKLFQL